MGNEDDIESEAMSHSKTHGCRRTIPNTNQQMSFELPQRLHTWHNAQSAVSPARDRSTFGLPTDSKHISRAPVLDSFSKSSTQNNRLVENRHSSFGESFSTDSTGSSSTQKRVHFGHTETTEARKTMSLHPSHSRRVRSAASVEDV